MNCSLSHSVTSHARCATHSWSSTRQNTDPSFSQMFCGKTGRDGCRPHRLPPHGVSIFDKVLACWTASCPAPGHTDNGIESVGLDSFGHSLVDMLLLLAPSVALHDDVVVGQLVGFHIHTCHPPTTLLESFNNSRPESSPTSIDQCPANTHDFSADQCVVLPIVASERLPH